MTPAQQRKLQQERDTYAGAIAARAATHFGELLDAINIRKAQAIAGDIQARREVQALIIALNPESLRMAAMGLAQPDGGTP